jgi:YD repeat-containing protein
VASHTIYTSDGEVIIDNYKYPLDYGTISSSSTGNVKGLKILQDKNIISSPIEHYRVKKKLDNSNSRVISGELSLWNSTKPYPDQFLMLTMQNPLSFTSFESSQVSGDAFIANAEYQPEVIVEAYDNYGNAKDVLKKDGSRESNQFGYGGNLLVASVMNARSTDFFYTSFEDTDGNSPSGDSKTGRMSRLGGYSTTVNGLLPNTNFRLTYFLKSGSTWIPQEQLLNTGTNTFLSFSLTGQIDEVRLYPVQAKITTYTHNPAIGLTSITDTNNISSYYVYDAIGRLICIKDDNGNILKTYSYNYKQ